MCISPHEMTSASLEEEIAGLERRVEQGAHSNQLKYWEYRIERLKEVLKERANDGTYDTAGRY